jgi:hypothetical protein
MAQVSVVGKEMTITCRCFDYETLVISRRGEGVTDKLVLEYRKDGEEKGSVYLSISEAADLAHGILDLAK